MKKFISCIMLIIIVFSAVSIWTFAENNPEVIPPERRASELIDAISCSLVRNGRSLTASCTVRATYFADKIGVTSFSIQEKRNGDWVSVKSVKDSYCYDDISYTGGLTYTGRKGYEYRAVANFYVKDGSLTDTDSKTSSVRTIPNT